MPVARTGYQALVNAVWGLVTGGVPLASRTVTPAGGTVTSVGTVTGNVNGGIAGNVNGGIGGNVNGSVQGDVVGSVGSVATPVAVGSGTVTSVSGNVGGSVLGNVAGSVGSVAAAVVVQAGGPATIRRTIRAVTTITEGNSAQTHALGVTVVEALCAVRWLGQAGSGGAATGDSSVQLVNSGNLQVGRSSTTGTTYVVWELTEMCG